jgi:hypothetical protein
MMAGRYIPTGAPSIMITSIAGQFSMTFPSRRCYSVRSAPSALTHCSISDSAAPANLHEFYGCDGVIVDHAMGEGFARSGSHALERQLVSEWRALAT